MKKKSVVFKKSGRKKPPRRYIIEKALRADCDVENQKLTKQLNVTCEKPNAKIRMKYFRGSVEYASRLRGKTNKNINKP